MDKPTLYLSNWSSHKTSRHGPGHAYTIMARPRRWERGEGSVSILTPTSHNLSAVKSGDITMEEYRSRYREFLRWYSTADLLPPGVLAAEELYNKPASWALVQDGDTLCCACAMAKAAAGECHRAWAAEALVKAGWRVVLDGRVMDV